MAWYPRLLGADRMPTKFEHHDVEDTGYGVLEPFPISTVVFRDPDDIQLKLIAMG